MFLYLTLYIQDNLGYGPLAAGIRFLPMTLVIFFISFFAGRLTVRVQSRFLLGIGMLIVTGGPPADGDDPSELDLDRATARVHRERLRHRHGQPGPGLGAVSVVQPQRSGMASGANNTFRQVGIATGIAVLGAVFQSQIVAHTTAASDKSPYGAQIIHRGGAQLQAAMAGGGVRQAAASLPASVGNALLDAYHVGLLHHLEPSDGDRGDGRLRRRTERVRPRPPARLHRSDRGADGPPAQGTQGATPDVPSRPCMREPFTLEGHSSGWSR